MSTNLIYLSSPYTAPTKGEMEKNYQIALSATAMLIKAGVMVYSPIVHNHAIAHIVGGTDWDSWKEHDLTTLWHCDALFILAMPGWERSVGMMAELRFAVQTDKPYWPVYFIDDYVGIWHNRVSCIANETNVVKILADWTKNKIAKHPVFQVKGPKDA